MPFATVVSTMLCSQRLFETTFRNDFDGARDFCDADERWQEAVSFLNGGNGVGWDLIKVMIDDVSVGFTSFIGIGFGIAAHPTFAPSG